MISYTINEQFVHVLTEEGSQIAREGSHEARVWAAAPLQGNPPLKLVDLKVRVGDDAFKVGQGRAFKNGWIRKEGDGIVKLVRANFANSRVSYIDVSQVKNIHDTTQIELQEIQATGTLKSGDKALSEIRKRKLATQRSNFINRCRPLT